MEGGEAHLSPAPGAGTILDENILDENPHLTVVKSISKSYGVPGLRLGIAASGDRDLIASLKKDVAIWTSTPSPSSTSRSRRSTGRTMPPP